MLNLKSVSQLFQAHQDDLHQRGVKSLAVFGSVARGESNQASDIDVLVEFERPVGLFEFIRLKYFLENLTGCSVDLVTPDAIRLAMRENIAREAVYVT
jgi:predicted nucleotidyltransferase